MSNNGKMGRLPKGSLFPRYAIGGLGLGAVLLYTSGAGGALAIIAGAMIVGLVVQKKYDQETEEGVSEGTMYVKKGGLF